MANPAAISFCSWDGETTFKTASTGTYKAFGQGVKITSLDAKNNVKRVVGLGDRNATALIPTNYEGTMAVEFNLANPWFLQTVMGTNTVTGSASSFTHTFTEANTIPSFTIKNSFDMDTDLLRTIRGCVANSCSISAEIGEVALARLDINFADETGGTTTVGHATETFDVFTFAEGSLEMPNGTTIAAVDSIDLTINNNSTMNWGLGSRFAVSHTEQQREYSATASIEFKDNSEVLDLFWGASTGPQSSVTEIADLELTFTNGLTGTNKRTIIGLFDGAQIDTDSLPQDPTVRIVEDVDIMMKSCSFTAFNSTSALP